MIEIVIAEDEEGIRLLVEAVVEEMGYGAIMASNGEVALGLIERARPALVISDVMMPVMNGYILLEQIRRRPQLFTTKVLLMSAAPIDRQGVYQADAYLSKPFELAGLQSVIERLVLASLNTL